MGERAHLLEQLCRRYDAVHDTPVEHRLGRIGPSGQDRLRGAAGARPRHEALRPSPERRCPDHRLDETEVGALRRPDQVAAQRHLQTGGEAQPLHGRHRGHRDLREPPDPGNELIEQLARRGLVAVEEHLHVRPGREVVTLGTHQDRAGVAVTCLGGRLHEAAHQLQPEEIQGWVREHDLPHVAVQCEIHLGHVPPPYGFVDLFAIPISTRLHALGSPGIFG